MSMLGLTTYDVCGVPIAAVLPDLAASLIARRAVAGGRFEVHLCNAYTLSLVGEDPPLIEALLAADLNLADGTPVAWFGRRYGMRGPVRGPALLSDVVRAGVSLGVRHYLYGGAPGVADQVAAALEQSVAGVQIVGTESPPYHDLDDAEMAALVERIKSANAHVVWVGLGTPRQDYFVRRLAPAAECAVVPVGAAFDFLSGRVAEAPKFLHGSSLEWTYRLVREPRRLWRRYLLGNPKFLFRALRGR